MTMPDAQVTPEQVKLWHSTQSQYATASTKHRQGLLMVKMNCYSDIDARRFTYEAETILRNFKGSPTTFESMHYLQLELDNFLLKWKIQMGFLPEVEGDCGTGTLKRMVVKQDGHDIVRIDFELEEDAEFVRKRDAVVQELMNMQGGPLEDGNGHEYD